MNKKISFLFFVFFLGFLLFFRGQEYSTQKIITKKMNPQKILMKEKNKQAVPYVATDAVKHHVGHEKTMETTIRNMVKDSLSEMSFEKVEEIPWNYGGKKVNAQSYIVTLKNDVNATTTFRVLVDAQSGKLMESWDQPIYDPVNPRNNFKVKIDPRYHND
jgi:hypothetical protein